MKLKELGEFAFIDRFCCPLGPVATGAAGSMSVGIGDDCAVLPRNDVQSYLVTTDLLVEGTHFLSAAVSPDDLGYKALAVNLSDIAAMGGTPLYAFLSLALPRELELSWVEKFFAGFGELARESQTVLFGGDTTKSINGIVINLAIVGEIETARIKFRSGAAVGDVLCVTDYLGDSGGGLEVVLRGLPHNDLNTTLLRRHYRPRPELVVGRWLAQHSAVHAMIDVSDGVDSDVQRIMSQSSCGAELDLDALPCSEELLEFCRLHQLDSAKIAAAAGEDYCLLLAVEPSALTDLQAKFSRSFHRALFPIGRCTDHTHGLRYLRSGTPTPLSAHGYDGFKT